MEQKISAWAESINKQALEDMGSRSKYSTMDHLVNYGRKFAKRKTLYEDFVDFLKLLT